jgi:hypothetical protein
MTLINPFRTMPSDHLVWSGQGCWVRVRIEDVRVRVSRQKNAYQAITVTAWADDEETEELGQIHFTEMARQGRFLLSDTHRGAHLWIAFTEAQKGELKTLFLLDVANELCPSYLEARDGTQKALDVWRMTLIRNGYDGTKLLLR